MGAHAQKVVLLALLLSLFACGISATSPPSVGGAVPRSELAPTRSATDPPDLLAGPIGDEQLNEIFRADHRSNIAPAVEQQLLTLAAEVLVADLTGAGRERFPAHLPGEIPAKLYSGVRIQAGVARQLTDPEPTVEARLLWAATSPTGERVERQTARVLLRYVDGRWQPISF